MVAATWRSTANVGDVSGPEASAVEGWPRRYCRSQPVCYSLLGLGKEAVVAVAGKARMRKVVSTRRHMPHLARVLLARIGVARADVLAVGLRLTARILRIRAVWIVVLSGERADRVGVCVLILLAVVGSWRPLLGVVAAPSHLTGECDTRT